VIIRININHEKDIAIVKERETANIFVIENVLSKRKTQSNLVGMVWSTYYSVSVFTKRTQYSTDKHLCGFLDENDIEVFIHFQYRVHEISVFSNIL